MAITFLFFPVVHHQGIGKRESHVIFPDVLLMFCYSCYRCNVIDSLNPIVDQMLGFKRQLWMPSSTKMICICFTLNCFTQHSNLCNGVRFGTLFLSSQQRSASLALHVLSCVTVSCDTSVNSVTEGASSVKTFFTIPFPLSS